MGVLDREQLLGDALRDLVGEIQTQLDQGGPVIERGGLVMRPELLSAFQQGKMVLRRLGERGDDGETN